MTGPSELVVAGTDGRFLARIKVAAENPDTLQASVFAQDILTFSSERMTAADRQSMIDRMGVIVRAIAWLENDRAEACRPANEILVWFRTRYAAMLAPLTKAKDHATKVDREYRGREQRVANEARIAAVEAARRAAEHDSAAQGLSLPEAEAFVMPPSNVSTGGAVGKSVGRREFKVSIADVVEIARTRPWLLELKVGAAKAELRERVKENGGEKGVIDGIAFEVEQGIAWGK